MKKFAVLMISLLALMSLLGCDFIEEQIQRERDRIESLRLEDFEIDIPARTVMLKITSNVDEQIIEEVSINGERLALVAQGDDWYLLEAIPIAKAYSITNVYYRSDLGPRIPFPIEYEITLSEALGYLSDDQLFEIEDSFTVDGYTFTLSDDALITIESDAAFTIDEFAEWVWVIFEDEVPLFVVFEYDDVVYLIDVPEEVSDLLE